MFPGFPETNAADVGLVDIELLVDLLNGFSANFPEK